MKKRVLVSTALALCAPGAAWAGEKVLTGPTPDWVAAAPPIVQPAAGAKSGSVLPRFDEQVMVDGDLVTIYIDTARVVSSAEVLSKMGTLQANWQPAHGDLIYHRIEILRNGQTIDVLKANPDFSVLRREAGLERLMVDGQLTAVKHIEGLQVGDILRTTFTMSVRDKVLAGNVQDGLFVLPSPSTLTYGRARLVWQTAHPIAWKAEMPGLTLTPKAVDSKWTELVVMMPVPKLPDTPKNAPTRFTPLPLIQFSSFPDWASVAKVMAPLYVTKGTIAAGSELAARVDAIAARSTDPEQRMADVLRVVQDEVRYQLIALGTGNYVPQAPADTWAKRYGDCKAKTMLLLAMLDRLGIEAEPVLANISRGDGIAQMLPAAMDFDHVFVRARVHGADYWLDGTMLGSRLPDIHDVPHYGIVLPLFTGDGKLVTLPNRAHARPDLDVDLTYDLTAGPHLASPFKLTLRYAGQFGEGNKVDQGPDYDDNLTKFAEKAAKSWTGSDTVAKPHAEWDEDKAVWTLQVDGIAYPDWKFEDGHYTLAQDASLKVTYDAPRDRASWRTIPALIVQPWTAHLHTVSHLPDNGQGIALTSNAPVRLDLPAVTWQRAVTLSGANLVDDTLSQETGAEIPAEATSVASKAIGDAMEKTPHMALPAGFPRRWMGVAARRGSPAAASIKAVLDERVAEKPDEAGRLSDRGWFEERLFDWAAAEADYTKAIAIDATAANYLMRTRLRALRGDHAGALADAQAAYDLEQGNVDARNRLANELAEAGKVDQGLDLLPTEPDVATDQGLRDFLTLVGVMETGGRHDAAAKLIDNALAKRNASAELHNARCWYQALHGQALDAALADCNKAIELASNPSEYLDSRAMVQFKSGHLDKALEDYASALASEPELSSSLFMSGIIHARLGDKKTATAEITAARTIMPGIDHFYQHYAIAP